MDKIRIRNTEILSHAVLILMNFESWLRFKWLSTLHNNVQSMRMRDKTVKNSINARIAIFSNSQNEAKEMWHEEGKLMLGFHARVNARLISKLETTKPDNWKTVSLPRPRTKRYDYIARESTAFLTNDVHTNITISAKC